MEKLWGFLLILLSAAAFGAMPIFGIYTYQDGINPISLLFYRFSFASVIMLFSMVIFKINFPKGKTLLILILMGSIGYAGQSITYFTALTLIPASLVAILLYIYPALVTILSTVFLKEKFTWAKFLALCLTLFGTVLVVGLKGGSDPLGIGLAILAALIYSIYIVVGTTATNRYGAFASSSVIITSAALTYGLTVAINGLAIPNSSTGWFYSFLIAVICTVMAIVAFFAGVRRIGPVSASMLSTFEPVVTVLMATLFLGELTNLTQYFGMVLILTGALILAKS